MNRRLWVAIIALVTFCYITAVGYAQGNTGNYFNIVDESGNVVYITGWNVQTGDQCITENNKRYEIINVEGNIANAKFIGDVNLAQYLPATNLYFTFIQGILQIPTVRAQGAGKVAIYHTHSDESYAPTDGKDSIFGAGGVYKVGDAFASALQAKGMEVIHSTAKHDPHDDMAYERSRRTVLDLLKQQPDCLFDVHRDSSPPEVYKTTINGQDVTKVQLVVGKYGPTGKQIEDYALQMKAAADKQHPGLIKGIFFAKGGDYNQDLHPRSMLLEVGSASNDRPSAERGIALFADIVPSILGKTTGSTQAAAGGTAGFGTTASGFSGASKSIGWIIGLLVVGVAAFLFLSTGGMKEAGAKLKQFTSTEFANFFGPGNQKKVRQEDNKDSNDNKKDPQE